MTRRPSSLTLLLALTLALLAVPVGAETDSGEADDSTMTVKLTVVEELRDKQFDNMGNRLDAETAAHGAVTAFVDGVECASTALDRNESELIIGLPEQPEECRREGARIELDNGLGMRMIETFEFKPGATVEMWNYAVPPRGTGPGSPAPAEVGGLGASPSASSGWLTGVAAAMLVLASSIAIRARLRRR